ncbi:uncharacterized protein BDR25DRAFT_354656 [Lindgomyces ingoldianus]|uniref:Uncharacterized protein n=1 Tax=Lindgomyces ingoldianus TaxID=673940 RepID=A0ACB6QWN8_9PLEO|nr:uncharacterized protein BDR25DRAFT_354656 [Lindgomyces ingoldianus]KAF2471419.1 hypothetical protein BDR25DRAFT_354656 [Lindgomyces ingoldianus]
MCAYLRLELCRPPWQGAAEMAALLQTGEISGNLKFYAVCISWVKQRGSGNVLRGVDGGSGGIAGLTGGMCNADIIEGNTRYLVFPSEERSHSRQRGGGGRRMVIASDGGERRLIGNCNETSYYLGRRISGRGLKDWGTLLAQLRPVRWPWQVDLIHMIPTSYLDLNGEAQDARSASGQSAILASAASFVQVLAVESRLAGCSQEPRLDACTASRFIPARSASPTSHLGRNLFPARAPSRDLRVNKIYNCHIWDFVGKALTSPGLWLVIISTISTHAHDTSTAEDKEVRRTLLQHGLKHMVTSATPIEITPLATPISNYSFSVDENSIDWSIPYEQPQDIPRLSIPATEDHLRPVGLPLLHDSPEVLSSLLPPSACPVNVENLDRSTQGLEIDQALWLFHASVTVAPLFPVVAILPAKTPIASGRLPDYSPAIFIKRRYLIPVTNDKTSYSTLTQLSNNSSQVRGVLGLSFPRPGNRINKPVGFHLCCLRSSERELTTFTIDVPKYQLAGWSNPSMGQNPNETYTFSAILQGCNMKRYSYYRLLAPCRKPLILLYDHVFPPDCCRIFKSGSQALYMQLYG